MRVRNLSILAMTFGIAACTTDGVGRNEGVSSRAGNAAAANTVMQMVDPWPYGVDDTDLEAPAERGTDVAAKEDGGGDEGGAPKTSGSDD